MVSYEVFSSHFFMEKGIGRDKLFSQTQVAPPEIGKSRMLYCPAIEWVQSHSLIVEESFPHFIAWVRNIWVSELWGPQNHQHKRNPPVGAQTSSLNKALPASRCCCPDTSKTRAEAQHRAASVWPHHLANLF